MNDEWRTVNEDSDESKAFFIPFVLAFRDERKLRQKETMPRLQTLRPF